MIYLKSNKNISVFVFLLIALALSKSSLSDTVQINTIKNNSSLSFDHSSTNPDTNFLDLENEDEFKTKSKHNLPSLVTTTKLAYNFSLYSLNKSLVSKKHNFSKKHSLSFLCVYRL